MPHAMRSSYPCPGICICTDLEKHLANLQMTLSGSSRQRHLVVIEAPRIYVMWALGDQQLHNVMQATESGVIQGAPLGR